MKAILGASALVLAAVLAPAAYAAEPNAGYAAIAAAKNAAATNADLGGAPFGTKAKLALYYSGFSGIIRSKGVKAVTNPSAGIVCITPSVALNLGGIYPQVSIDWNLSSGSSLLAYTKDTNAFSDCPAGDLEVTTYTFDANGPILSNNVAFNLVIG
jgi:hypothetical protein